MLLQYPSCAGSRDATANASAAGAQSTHTALRCASTQRTLYHAGVMSSQWLGTVLRYRTTREERALEMGRSYSVAILRNQPSSAGGEGPLRLNDPRAMCSLYTTMGMARLRLFNA